MLDRIKTNIIPRDMELTAFKHYVLEHPNESMNTNIDNFPFQYINATRYRANLIVIGYESLRYPYRVPTK